MLSQEAVKEFQDLYKKEFGIRLNKDRAIEYGTKLIDLVKTVYGSNLPKKWVSGVDRKKLKKIG